MKNEVITYTETVAFNYVLPGDDKTYTIDKDLTLIWEESLEKLFEEKGDEVVHQVHTFSTEQQKKYFVDKIEDTLDEEIEEVEEEIANKTKYGFEFTGQLHNDD